jgi:polar amino acid transport system substrate-binding protein
MIPLLRASPEYALRWLVSSDPVHAKQLTTRYRFEKSTCDLNEALADPAVSLVVITAPNNLHFQMLESTMRAGKLALLEKPLCVTREEFERIKLLQAETKLPVIVGFNRRYAPLVLEMKKRLQEMDGPFVLNYRVNAGFVPASKWSQDPNLGGGRVIHECCHFFDLFNFLLGQTNPRIVAESAGVSGSNSVARDNISVSLRYPNGSLANLVYVAMGGRSMDRERLEVHGQRSSFVLDDFINLEFFGGSKQSWRLPRQDKGHHAELEQVANKIHGKPTSLISTEEVFNATELTFRVDEAIRGSSPS